MKYEKHRDKIEASEKQSAALLDEYQDIADRLMCILEKNPESGYVAVILDLINEIIEHLLAEQIKTKKGIGEIMGGQIMTLASDQIAEEARLKGRENGIIDNLISLVKKGLLSEEDAIQSAREEGIPESAYQVLLGIH